MNGSRKETFDAARNAAFQAAVFRNLSSGWSKIWSSAA